VEESVHPHFPSDLEQRLESLHCSLPLLPPKSRLWRGNQTHEINLPVKVSQGESQPLRQATANYGKPWQAMQAGTSYDKPRQATASRDKPRQAMQAGTSHDKPRQATASHASRDKPRQAKASVATLYLLPSGAH